MWCALSAFLDFNIEWTKIAIILSGTKIILELIAEEGLFEEVVVKHRKTLPSPTIFTPIESPRNFDFVQMYELKQTRLL